MLKQYLAAIFAVLGFALFFFTFFCPRPDPLICSVMHPASYMVVVFCFVVSIVLLTAGDSKSS